MAAGVQLAAIKQRQGKYRGVVSQSLRERSKNEFTQGKLDHLYLKGHSVAIMVTGVRLISGLRMGKLRSVT